MVIKQWVYVVMVWLVFGAGWLTRDWYEDSKDLAEKKATEAVVAAFERKESEIAKSVESKLQELKANETIIERWRTKVVDRPIYNVQCIDDDGMRIIEAYSNGKTAVVTGEVSENTASSN